MNFAKKSVKKMASYAAVLAIFIGVFAINTTQASAFDFFSLFHWYPYSTPQQQDQKEISDLISHGNNIASQLNNRIASLQGIAATLLDQANQASAQGIDVSDAWNDYNQAVTTIATAQADLATATGILNNASDVIATDSNSSDQAYTNTLTSLNSSLTQALENTEDQIKDAHQDLLNMTVDLQNDLANPVMVAPVTTPTGIFPSDATTTDATSTDTDATSTIDYGNGTTTDAATTTSQINLTP